MKNTKKEPKTKTKTPIEAFYVAEPSSQGVKVPLSLPTGEDSGHWLIIRGIQSKEFRQALQETHRMGLQLEASKEEDKISDEDYQKRREEIDLHAYSALVKDWSFDDPEFTPFNVCELLKNAPQIKTEVDRFASNISNFAKTNFD